MTRLAYADRVQEFAQNVGTSSFGLLGAAATNLRTFAAAGLNGDTVAYTAQHRTSGQWEVGIGVFTAPNVLTRVTVLCNSSGTTNHINFSGGLVDVWNDLPAEKLIGLNDDSSLSLPGDLHVIGSADFYGIADAGVIAAGTWNGDVIAGAYGGTGVANTGKTINLGGSLSTSDALTFTLTGPTSVTLPTSGTLVNDAVTSLNSLANVGTLITGTWHAGVIAGAYGGTGVANTGKTITLGGNLAIAGAFNLTVTITGDTTVTLPTSGTLVNTTGNVATATALQNARLINGVSFDGTANITVTAAAGTLTGTTLASNVVSSSLTTVGVIASGTWQGTSIGTTYTDAKIKTVTGTAANITVAGTSTDPIISIAATYAGQTSITTLGTIVSGTWTGSSIAIAYTDAKVGSISGVSNRTTVTGTTAVPIIDISATYAGQASITTLGTIVSGTWNGTAINNTYIATGLDVAKLTAGTTLPSNITTSSLTGVGAIVTGSWSATAVGALYGGTGLTSYATGDIIYASALNTLSKLAGNTTTVRQFLSSTGTGVNAQAPAWTTIVSADVSDATSANTVSTIVKRDGSGNFSAGTITAALAGNASTATALATARTFWGQSFDGTANVAGALTGVTTITTSSTINGQTISSAANFTGTLTVASTADIGGATNGLSIGSVAGKNRIQWNTDHFELVSTANALTAVQVSTVIAKSDLATYSEPSAQVRALGSTDPNKQVVMGINTTANIGFIQATQFGTATLPLWLQPSGSYVKFSNATDPVIIGNAATYGMVTFNSSINTSAGMGLFGRVNGTEGMYYNTPSGTLHRFTVNGSGVLYVSGSDAQMSGNFIALTDATYDFGASGANRFRDGFLSRNLTIGGTLTAAKVISTGTVDNSMNAGLVFTNGNDTFFNTTGSVGLHSNGVLYVTAGSTAVIIAGSTSRNVQIQVKASIIDFVTNSVRVGGFSATGVFDALSMHTNTASIATTSGVSATLIALGAVTVNGESYLVTVGASTYTAGGWIVVAATGAGWAIVTSNLSACTASLSGNNLQITQSTGVAQSFDARAIHIL